MPYREAAQRERDADGARFGDESMSIATDKINGLADEAVGNVTQGIGNATGNDKLPLPEDQSLRAGLDHRHFHRD